ncbi:hypothetical protein [uncultured Ruminococcus sp.]|uniref:hypothetical protein n=1 Tax=uncultured Ruminococcus sp. TaxID=165186 RepID=UPI0025E32FE5|nr:hypothetical protein [uncultured Ruminococcus sp.]
MKNKLKKTTSMLCALTVAAVPMTMSAFTASATENTNTVSDYMLTIPSTFTVANEGWNEIEGGVKASGTLTDDKVLVVTAQSDNNWALKSGENAIGYNLAKAGDEASAYSKDAEVPTWEFGTLTAEGASQTAGLIVDNYDEAPAGNYSDNVVFTATLKKGISIPVVDGEPLKLGYEENDTWQDVVDKHPDILYVYTWSNEVTSVDIVKYNGKELKHNDCKNTFTCVSPSDKVVDYDFSKYEFK